MEFLKASKPFTLDQGVTFNFADAQLMLDRRPMGLRTGCLTCPGILAQPPSGKAPGCFQGLLLSIICSKYSPCLEASHPDSPFSLLGLKIPSGELVSVFLGYTSMAGTFLPKGHCYEAHRRPGYRGVPSLAQGATR